MNAIQTFWANPGLSPDRIHGEWLDPRFHFMSWALSASLLNQHFDHTVLHTDQAGSHILIDLLELPYQEVQFTQEGMDALYPKNWWVLRKLNSFTQTAGAFVHVDEDAFLWNGLPAHLYEKPVIVQNDQSRFLFYDIAEKQLKEAGIPMPHFFKNLDGQYKAINTGIIGGRDVDFFKGYAAEIKEYYQTYLATHFVETQNTKYLNALIEECFFRQYADYVEKPVTAMISSIPEQGYNLLANCMHESYGITHISGRNKKNIYYCKQVEFQLKRRFPETYQKVARFVEGSFKNKAVYSFPNLDLFPESNHIIKKINPELDVTIGNCRILEEHFREEGNVDLAHMMRFEYSRFKLFQKLMLQSDKLNKSQQERLAVLNQLLDQDIMQRLNDTLYLQEHIPVMSFKYPGKSNPYYLAAVYDFAFGYRHIAHRPLDGIAIFILLSKDNPITLENLIKLFFRKASRPVDEDQYKLLLQKIDLKVKELLFLGLIDYRSGSEMLTINNTDLENTGT